MSVLPSVAARTAHYFQETEATGGRQTWWSVAWLYLLSNGLIIGTRSPESWAPDLGSAYSTNRIWTKWLFSLEACFPICKMKGLEAVVSKAPFSCNILDISPVKQKTNSYFWISNAIKEADSLTGKKWRLQSALSRFLWRSDKLGENAQRLEGFRWVTVTMDSDLVSCSTPTISQIHQNRKRVRFSTGL